MELKDAIFDPKVFTAEECLNRHYDKKLLSSDFKHGYRTGFNHCELGWVLEVRDVLSKLRIYIDELSPYSRQSVNLKELIKSLDNLKPL